jgi:hypothetical protein
MTKIVIKRGGEQGSQPSPIASARRGFWVLLCIAALVRLFWGSLFHERPQLTRTPPDIGKAASEFVRQLELEQEQTREIDDQSKAEAAPLDNPA